MTPVAATPVTPPPRYPIVQLSAAKAASRPTTAKVTKTGRPFAGVWQHFTRGPKNTKSGKYRACCNYCGKTFPRAQPTMHLIPHLLNKCNDIDPAIIAQVERDTGVRRLDEKRPRPSGSSPGPRPPINQEHFKKLFAQMVSSCDLTLESVDNNSMRALFGMLAPSLQLPTGQELDESLLPQARSEAQGPASATIKKFQDVSITMDAYRI